MNRDRPEDSAPVDLAEIRIDYDLEGLRRQDLEGDPMVQFERWMKAALGAADLREPTAMTLATVDPDGMPAARTVLLKGFDRRGFRFFTNYASDKGRDLDAEPRAALLFFWPELQRQLRIRGRVERLPLQESADYFHSRPRGSQLSAWCSPQSQPVRDRAELEELQRSAEDRFAGGEVELPEDWGGMLLVPDGFEFWQGR
ncbi:MAG: pyridoxamine 5'-phosphate oxidase, partial [Acidobacteriota bacterium]